jgi:hypothetical protein
MIDLLAQFATVLNKHTRARRCRSFDFLVAGPGAVKGIRSGVGPLARTGSRPDQRDPN